MTPLLRELIVEAVRIGSLRSRNVLHSALKNVIVANIEAATSVPTSLMLPKDRRAVAVADETIADPARNRSFATLCRRAGVSTRTVERIFQREVGTDFETWRRQARLMKAVELLVAGHSVKETSLSHRLSSAQCVCGDVSQHVWRNAEGLGLGTDEVGLTAETPSRFAMHLAARWVTLASR